jgi:hypothetical protein
MTTGIPVIQCMLCCSRAVTTNDQTCCQEINCAARPFFLVSLFKAALGHGRTDRWMEGQKVRGETWRDRLQRSSHPPRLSTQSFSIFRAGGGQNGFLHTYRKTAFNSSPPQIVLFKPWSTETWTLCKYIEIDVER